MHFYHQTYTLSKYQVKASFKHINQKCIETFKYAQANIDHDEVVKLV